MVNGAGSRRPALLGPAEDGAASLGLVEGGGGLQGPVRDSAASYDPLEGGGGWRRSALLPTGLQKGLEGRRRSALSSARP